jgi:hypothetical protein
VTFDDLELRPIENTIGAMCRHRSPAQLRDELKITYEIDGHNVSVYEVRPRWNNPREQTKLGVARFKFVRSRKEWKLYWMRRDLKWHLYNLDEIPTDLKSLVKVVDEDRYGAFFG